MTKNPLINAIAASTYIIIVALLMFYGSQFAPHEDTIFAPIAVISLFTLSAAAMGYIFCYQPLIYIIDNKKKEAVDLFLKTTFIFGGITIVLLLIFFSGIIK
jgi:hypothetical protein